MDQTKISELVSIIVVAVVGIAGVFGRNVSPDQQKEILEIAMLCVTGIRTLHGVTEHRVQMAQINSTKPTQEVAK